MSPTRTAATTFLSRTGFLCCPAYHATCGNHRFADAACDCPGLKPLRTLSTWCSISSRGPGGMPASLSALRRLKPYASAVIVSGCSEGRKTSEHDLQR